MFLPIYLVFCFIILNHDIPFNKGTTKSEIFTAVLKEKHSIFYYVQISVKYVAISTNYED